MSKVQFSLVQWFTHQMPKSNFLDLTFWQKYDKMALSNQFRLKKCLFTANIQGVHIN